MGQIQLILVWTPGKQSPIHDHANSHCVMKVSYNQILSLETTLQMSDCEKTPQVLRGSLKETLYTWPDRNVVNAGKPSPLRIQKETVYANNQVTYMSDNVRGSY